MHPLSDERQQVDLPAGGTAVVEFRLTLAPMHEHITVTAFMFTLRQPAYTSKVS